MTTMNMIFLLLSFQAVLGAFDNLWHHELEARLPQRPAARRELALHAAREAIYGVVFLGLAWWEWRGALAALLGALLLAELVITLADFLEEDRTRHLPPLERVLHTVLTISYGVFLAVVAPVLWGWAQEPTALVLAPHGWISWLFTLYAVGVWAWSARNMLAVAHLGHLARSAAQQAQTGLPPAAATAPAILVTGATGFVGTALVDSLVREGRRVIALSRDPLQARASLGPGVWVVDSLDAIPAETRIEAIVNLAGARVLGLPWTAARRRTLLASRVDTTTAVVALMRRLQQRPRVLVSASAVGYYGAPPGASLAEALDEAAPPRAGEFQSDLCVAIEHEARRAEALGVRVVRLRLGVVLGHGGGAYPMQAVAARLGLGTVLGTGRQPAPWVHLDDAVGLIRFALDEPRVQGPLNAVAPESVTQAQLAQAMAASFGRRARLRVPAGLLRRALGEMATLLVDGQNAVPHRALGLGYTFAHPTLDGALRQLAAQGPRAVG